MTRLTAFAETLSRSAWRRHLLFALCTLVTLLFIGYYFGTFDQVFHIPSSRSSRSHAVPNDPFFEMRFQHYSYFWFLWIPFYNLACLRSPSSLPHPGDVPDLLGNLAAVRGTFPTPLTSFLGTVALSSHASALGASRCLNSVC
jgi:hypothetical protein